MGMVTMTPNTKKAPDEMLRRLSSMMKSKKGGFILMVLGLLVFMGTVVIITFPNHDTTGLSIKGNRGNNNSERKKVLEYRTKSENQYDPVESKIGAIERNRQRTIAKEKALSSESGSDIHFVHEHGDRLTHHDNPGINARHGKEDDDHDRTNSSGEVHAIDNSHDASHKTHDRGDSAASAVVEKGPHDDPMYHNKFHHSHPEDHPHKDSSSNLGSNTDTESSRGNVHQESSEGDDTERAHAYEPLVTHHEKLASENLTSPEAEMK